MNSTNKMTEGRIIKNGKVICTQITINATPEKVWSVLTNFNVYSEWNPFITSISGNVSAGSKIAVTLQQPGAKPMTMNPEVLVFEKNKELRWIGSLIIPYIFDGEHTFRLQDNKDGSCTFIQSECFRGLLVPFLSGMLNTKTIAGFKLMNESLKKRCEME